MEDNNFREYLEMRTKIIFNRIRLLTEGYLPISPAIKHFALELGQNAGIVFFDLDGKSVDQLFALTAQLEPPLHQLVRSLPRHPSGTLSGQIAIACELRKLLKEVRVVLELK